jgi:hypothetical protein
MDELETFKRSINLVDFVAFHGFSEIDRLKSSRACTVLRRGGEKIGISQDSNNNHWLYFDIRKEKGGTIIDFLQSETNYNLGEIRRELRSWSGSPAKGLELSTYRLPVTSDPDRLKVTAEYGKCEKVNRSHPFLESRGIKPATYLSNRFSDSLFWDHFNNIVFPHYDTEGLCGLEKRNNKFWGFSDQGKKGMWFSRSRPEDRRFVFCESGIDALSYFQLKDDNVTRYFSLCGNLSDDVQIPLLKVLIAGYPDTDFILAFDNDQGGRKMIKKIETTFPEKSFFVDLPSTEGDDWNDMLQN